MGKGESLAIARQIPILPGSDLPGPNDGYPTLNSNSSSSAIRMVSPGVSRGSPNDSSDKRGLSGRLAGLSNFGLARFVAP